MKLKQSNKFTKNEGRAWLARNKDKLPPLHDDVTRIILKNKLAPTSVLEIGCANGWRLEKLKQLFGCKIEGIDPGADHHEWIKTGTADRLGYRNNSFDLVIFGFCLYLVDREDLFKVAHEADRVLKDGGHLIIHDFFVMMDPYKRKYEHADGIFSYHMNYFKLWCANPAYTMIDAIRPDDDTVVHLLKKDIEKGWPLHE